MAANSHTPSLARKHKLGSSTKTANRAFVVEALVLLAFLAVSVAIVLQLFAAAGVQSREAHRLTVSEHLATNAAESFAANPQGVSSLLYFDTEGEPLEGEKGAAYSVESTVVPQRTKAGTMYSNKIVVKNYDLRYDGDITYELETKHYLSALEGGGAL